jgi:hypothetical protein
MTWPGIDFNPEHTDWCARDHQCGAHGEHRAAPITLALHRQARATITRVRDGNGREYAEIRARVALTGSEPYARRQLVTLLYGLRDLVLTAVSAGRPAPRRRGRRVA